MKGKSFIILLFLLLVPVNVLCAKEAMMNNLRDGSDVKAIRELTIDETLRKLALENAKARYKKKREMAIKKLDMEETQRRLAMKKEEPRFFFTLRNGIAMNAQED